MGIVEHALSVKWRTGLLFMLVCTAGLFFLVLPAKSQDTTALQRQLKGITDQLKAQNARLTEQDRLLKLQQDAIDAQRDQISKINSRSVQTNPGATGLAAASPNPSAPVGEAPPKPPEEPPQVVQSLPQGIAVLTPEGRFTFMPSVEYTQTTANRLVFEGIVIVPGINLGEVTATTDDRSIVSAVVDLRYGITSKLEVEARVPFTFSDDRATFLVQGPQNTATQSIYISNTGIGDIEFGARYQINSGRDDWPVFVANSRLKLDTGTGPFDIKRDLAGIAEGVPLGSGFTALEGGFSALKLSDPVVLYASVNYIYQIPKDINKIIANVPVGHVDPSSSVNLTMGFGFAVNPDFSFSMGYEHNHVFPQTTELGTTTQTTTSLEVGAMTLGMAYRLSPTLSLNANFEFGVTQAAPDVRAIFMLPITF
ncbi:MAG TPA: hypothetical protein VN175_14255 [Rhizomicrobium sp.]|nr:hypothetical protein [Rhizomicrobium sp.]